MKTDHRSMKKEPRNLQKTPLYTLHVVSDATGGLARHMIETVLTQFPDLKYKEVYHIYQGEWLELKRTLRSIKGKNQLVLLALTDPWLKRTFIKACEKMNIPSFDLLGSLVEFLAKSSGSTPVHDVTRVHKVNQEYLRRIEALEFTLQHDDSRRIETATDADIVIIGVSRVSKTPTSTFLGSLGYKVANVSIVPTLDFPKELEGIRDKTVALTIDPRRLHEIRNRRFSEFKRRIRTSGFDDLSYYDLRAISSEVLNAEEEYRRRGLPVLDSTAMTVEEVAAKIIRILKVSTERATYA